MNTGGVPAFQRLRVRVRTAGVEVRVHEFVHLVGVEDCGELGHGAYTEPSGQEAVRSQAGPAAWHERPELQDECAHAEGCEDAAQPGHEHVGQQAGEAPFASQRRAKGALVQQMVAAPKRPVILQQEGAKEASEEIVQRSEGVVGEEAADRASVRCDDAPLHQA